MKILVIEDNSELAQNIKDYLLREGYVCELAKNYGEAIDNLSSFQYDCVVLDIMLPDGNGLNILEFIKSQKLKSGILIVSLNEFQWRKRQLILNFTYRFNQQKNRSQQGERRDEGSEEMEF